MKRTLVIDDRRLFDHDRDRDFSGEVVYARTGTSGQHQLARQGRSKAYGGCSWTIVYLDHDLGWGPSQEDEDIRATVRWICEHADRFPHTQFYSCSSNYHGRLWTVATLREAGLKADEKEPKCKLHRF